MEDLAARLSNMIPGFGSIVFSTAVPGRIGWGVEFEDARGVVNARNLSAGNLSLVGFSALGAFRQRARNPVLICVEEPEMGLTPTNAVALFKEFVALAESAAAQVVISTHSPHIAHEQLARDQASVFRMVPIDGVGTAAGFRASIVETQGPEGWALVQQGGGMGVNAVLRSMESF